MKQNTKHSDYFALTKFRIQKGTPSNKIEAAPLTTNYGYNFIKTSFFLHRLYHNLLIYNNQLAI